MTLIGTVDSLTMALTSVKSIQESEWSSLDPAMIDNAKSSITRSNAACVRFCEDFGRWTSRSQDGSLSFSDQFRIGYFKKTHLVSMNGEVRTWQARITSVVSIANLYELPIYRHD
jgi:hypothetical protein